VTALAGWPYAQRSAEINGHTRAYLDEGAGPPVLLVHGNPTWSFYYRSLLAALAPARAPDHRCELGLGGDVTAAAPSPALAVPAGGPD